MMDILTNTKHGTAYVIEGQTFRSREAAAQYLVRTGDMEPEEAYGYLARLGRQYQQRVHAGLAQRGV